MTWVTFDLNGRASGVDDGEGRAYARGAAMTRMTRMTSDLNGRPREWMVAKGGLTRGAAARIGGGGIGDAINFVSIN